MIEIRDEILEAYIERTPKSKELWDEARELIPGGTCSGFRCYDPYPTFVDRASGSKVWDVDGNRYVDLCMSFGAALVGHANPKVVEAVREQLEKGTMYGIPHPRTALYVKEIRRRFPAMEMMRMTNSGTESTMHAIRVARAYTGKDKIVKMEGCYHGAHNDALISVHPPLGKIGPSWAPAPYIQGSGIPANILENVLVAPFNDVEAMERLFRKHEGEIGALIMEPVPMNIGVILPKEGYLEAVRKLTEEHNILLILDEVKTGCKVAPGGATEYYGLEPDMITLSKSIGAGFSIGAFGGRAEVMEEVSPVGRAFHGGTYNANPVAVTAGLTGLTEVLTDDATARMNKLGDKLAKGVADQIEEANIKARVQHIGSAGTIYFGLTEEVLNLRMSKKVDEEAGWNFWFSLLNNGVITPPGLMAQGEQWHLSAMHDDEDIERALEATHDALEQIK